MTKLVPPWLFVCCAMPCVALAKPGCAQDMPPAPVPVMTTSHRTGLRGDEALPSPATVIATIDGVDAAEDTPKPVAPYRLRARVLAGERELWAGDLAMTHYGRANVRTYVQDMDANCPLKNDRFAVRRHTIDLSVAPGNREGPYRYKVEANWTAPAEACSDDGMRGTGVRVEVELAEKQTYVIEGERGLRVELVRLP
ncbi:hypothetical protein [Erythrobacter donghaensis]|uniref:hypothetical protein n=1 Tax=Erythrobacter donghaensis TaxID=267135 RepID=UPI00117E5CC7|nr:hypothetical protein [Erythrobacter donghaensis]